MTVPGGRFSLGVAACMALLAGSAAAARAAPTARLVYSRAVGAESCPDEDEVRRAIAARVGYDAFFPWAQKTVVASMAPAPAHGFVATVSLVDEHGYSHGAREIRTSGPCGELRDAAALAIAIAIDPQLLAPRPDEPPAPPPAPPPPPPEPGEPAPAPPAAIAPTEVAPVPVARPPSGPHVVAEGTAGVVGSLGVAPLATVGLSLGATARRGRLSVAVEGRVDAPVSESVGASASANFWLALGGVAVCGDAGPFLACALGQLGSIQTSSDGVAGAHPGSAFVRSIDGDAFGIEFTSDGHFYLLSASGQYDGDPRDTTLERLTDPAPFDASAPASGTFEVVSAASTLGPGTFQARLTASDGGIHLAQVEAYGSPPRIRFFAPDADDYVHALTKAYQANVCGPPLGPRVTPAPMTHPLQGRWARCDDGVVSQSGLVAFVGQGLEFDADGSWEVLVEDPSGALVPTSDPASMGTYTPGPSPDDVALQGGEGLTPQFDACGGMVFVDRFESGPTMLYRRIP